MCLHGRRIQLTQQLKPNNHVLLREFVELIIEQMYGDFWSKIILSDVSHFLLDGFINLQNSRFWGSGNLQLIVKKQMH